LGVIVLDTPSSGIIKISSSCDLPKSSLKADSRRSKGAGAAPEMSPSASIRDLWPDIDKLDEINSGDASIENVPGNVIHGQRLMPSVVRTNENVRHVVKRIVVNDAPRRSNAPPGGRGRGSAKKKATLILFTAPKDISPRMQRSFINRQYSPSTGMDQSEWEIILDDLTRMGYIVKEEPKMVVNDRLLLFVVVVALCDLFWNVAFVRCHLEISYLCDSIFRYRLREIPF
jgi:hypothetical protein